MASPRVAETNKKPGVHYAVTNDGLELPIVDVTHPAFALSVTDGEQKAQVARFLRERQPLEHLPAGVRNFLLRALLRGSALGPHLTTATGFLGGMGTYLLKLGPDNLGPYATWVDRKVAAGFPAVTMRWRLQDMARLLADALAPMLAEGSSRSVHLFNIAGGPALDSLNALRLLRRERPASLAGRKIVVTVLDGDDDGPAFGARALTAWQADGAPLAGLDVAFRHVPYDWRRAESLRAALEGARADNAHAVASSEGGLFEYGADDEIVGNLTTLRELRERGGDDLAMVGSVTRADAPMQRLLKLSPFALRPRGLPVFRELARRAGFNVTRVVERPFSDHVVLMKRHPRELPR